MKNSNRENEILSFYIMLFLLALAIALGLAFAVDAQEDVQPEERPRYSLVYREALYFQNHESLPFQIIRGMCWDDAEDDFCDAIFQTEDARQIWAIIDWQTDTLGAIYQIGDECYWWMFQDVYGDDGHPHIDENYWVSCPEIN